MIRRSRWFTPTFRSWWPYLTPTVAEGVLAAGLLADPAYFQHSGPMAACAALALGALAAVRAVEWRTKCAAERALHTHAPFQLTALVRPAHGDLYLGRGFEWTGAEAQQIVNLERQHRLPKPDGRGIAALHGVGAAREHDVWIPREELGGHIFITGATGVGKTRLLELIIGQAIARGEAVLVIDPKWDRDPRGGLIDRVYEACHYAGRSEKFRLVSLLHPHISMHTNPLQNFSLAAEIPDRLAELLPGMSGDAQSFREYGRGFISKIVQAQLEVNESPTLENLRAYYLSRKNIESLITRQPPGSRARSGLQWILEHDKAHLQKIISILDPLFEKLTSADIGHVLSPTAADWSAGRILDYDRILEEGLVGYINTGSLTLGETGYTIARLWLQDFVSFMGRRYAYGKAIDRPMTVVIDEFGNIASRGAVDLINKGRGGGLRLALGAQTFSDLRKNLDEAAALQVIGNCNIRIALRADYEMARTFSELVGKTAIRRVSQSVRISPNSGRHAPIFDASVSLNTAEQADSLVRPEWISGLPRGQAFVHLGGTVWKIRIPLLWPLTVPYPIDDETAFERGESSTEQVPV